jgi:outer membrane protein assembly factor BamE (lipoprotein component of BamABCDE complex)
MVKNSLILLVCFALSGCLFTVDSDGRVLSNTWDEADVNRLQMGQSDTAWVRTTFGEPTSLLRYADGSEIWKYRNRSEKDTEVGLFLLFSVDVEEERVETLSIEFDQDKVSNYWIEEDRF